MSGKGRTQRAHDYYPTSEITLSPLQNAAALYEIKKRGLGAHDIDELADELGVNQWAARQWAIETLCGHTELYAVRGGFVCASCGKPVPA